MRDRGENAVLPDKGTRTAAKAIKILECFIPRRPSSPPVGPGAFKMR